MSVEDIDDVNTVLVPNATSLVTKLKNGDTTNWKKCICPDVQAGDVRIYILQKHKGGEENFQFKPCDFFGPCIRWPITS